MSLNNIKKRIRLPINFSVNEEVSDSDNRFLKVTIDVLHTGVNFNDCEFSKEVVDENADTIKNTPILGFIEKTDDNAMDFKGHEYKIVSGKDGNERVYIGSSYGVIPESCNYRWVTKTCSDGEEREYFQVDGLLWTKFKDAASIMTDCIEKPNSMELDEESIDGYEDENGIFHFTKFSFNGCCILGDNIEPAMIDSNIRVNFSINDFIKNIQDEIKNKCSVYSRMIDSDDNIEDNKQGGNNKMPNNGNKDFTLSAMQQFENISNIVQQQETFVDRWGDSISRYSLVDIQDDEVIVVDRKDSYNYYGFKFTINGDAANIDFACGTRKKISYENFDEGTVVQEGAFEFGKAISEIEDKAFSKVEDANQKISEAEEKAATAEQNYTKLKSDYDTMKTDYDKFVTEEQKRKDAEVLVEKQNQFARFEKVLADDSEFAKLKENISELSVQEIEDKCSVLYARKNLAAFSKSPDKPLTISISDDNSNEDENGIETDRYGYISFSR